MKNGKLLSTLVYIYIIILVFTILYYMYSTNDVDYFDDSVITMYNDKVNTNISNISTYITNNEGIKNKNVRINTQNKDTIDTLMSNSVGKLRSMIDNYVLTL